MHLEWLLVVYSAVIRLKVAAADFLQYILWHHVATKVSDVAQNA